MRRYLPNAFATAKGETPFFDRVLPWLQTAERWLFSQFVGDGFADTFLTLDPDKPMRVIAEGVKRQARGLDLDIVDFSLSPPLRRVQLRAGDSVDLKLWTKSGETCD